MGKKFLFLHPTKREWLEGEWLGRANEEDIKVRFDGEEHTEIVGLFEYAEIEKKAVIHDIGCVCGSEVTYGKDTNLHAHWCNKPYKKDGNNE